MEWKIAFLILFKMYRKDYFLQRGNELNLFNHTDKFPKL